MTLIIKELVIRGIVSRDSDLIGRNNIEKEELTRYLAQMKKEMEKDCIETILSKIEANRSR